ncbi:histidine kinase [Solirubrobacter ginsenosidimutans]|uniref:Histidine kinase n=1 Tax=Solirubrobacter ginsenosidimutans TaxID=490573 RepID=A0A9X3MLE9_9ACTN|nr:histidine kinase [Solirubrobacter ginsenosidimutans]MDA0158721.1 histidine kinase [Solirubrobacter ginsenosidimutans]
MRSARVVVSVLVLAYALAVVLVLPRSGPLITSYARASDAAQALALVCGLALLGAGLLTLWERPRDALGPVALAAGAAWFATDWVGWEGGPPLARSLGMVLAPLLPALLLQLASPPRPLVVAGYAATAAVSLGLALFRDPFEDERCWSNCTDNVFLARADEPVARVLGGLSVGIAIVLGLALVATTVRRLAGASPTGRRALWPLLAPLAIAGAAGAGYALALSVAVEDPRRTGFAALYLIRAVALTGVAAGLVWIATRARRTRAAVARVAAARAVPLRDVLAQALRDPALEVAYPLPGSDRTVDARGRPAALGGSGRALTRIVRSGRPVAIVSHDATLLDGPELEREIGAAARLAVDNERLEAVVRAHVEDLRASRARIVESGDLARRRLERDLHDGAQQRLLALSFELRLAQAGAQGGVAAALTEAAGEAQASLDELRELAHGIYPAILAEAGLEAALQTLAEAAPLPVELGDITGERFPASVETAAYLLVAAAVEEAGGHLSVAVRRDGRLLRISLADGRGGPAAAARRLADRVGALGGRIDVHGGAVVAELPCA